MQAIEHIKLSLKKFYQRYYLIQFLLGMILSFIVLSLSWYLLSFSEYFSYFSIPLKKIMFIGYFGLAIGLIIWKVVLPLLKYFKWQNGLNEEEMAVIIGEFFKNKIDDKLLNTLQLINNQVSPFALKAAEQKALTLKTYDFTQAIDKKTLIQWLKIAIVPLCLFIITFTIQPNLLSDGTKRILQFNSEFSPPNPYQYELDNQTLTVLMNEDLVMEVKFNGTLIPDALYWISNDKYYRFERNKQIFTYQLNGVNKGFDFKLQMGSHFSPTYEVVVLQKPVLQEVVITVESPTYTSIPLKKYQNTSLIILPEGAKVSWDIIGKDLDVISIMQADKLIATTDKNQFSYSFKQIIESMNFQVIASQEKTAFEEAINYRFEVVKDAYPEITVEEFMDSTYLLQKYFSGLVKDDYGISKTLFVVEIGDSLIREQIQIQGINLGGRFNHFVDFKQYEALAESVNYYFITWDNDGVNGAKFTKSIQSNFRFPSQMEKDRLLSKSNENLKKEMDEVLNLHHQQEQKIKAIKNRLKEKTDLDWQDQKSIRDYLKQQESLDQKLKELQQKRQDNKDKNNTLKKDLSDEFLAKQKQLDELFDRLMDDELKKMFEELEKLMDELNNKREVQDLLEQIELDTKSAEKELERTLELFKQFEVETMLQETIDELNEMVEKQEELMEQNGKEDNEELSKQQEDLNNQFDQLKDKWEELMEKNKDLKRPKEIDELKEEQDKVADALKKSLENLQQKNEKKTKQEQQKAKNALEDMAKKMQQMQQDSQGNQQMEDVQTLRQILKNLLFVSTEQEALMLKTQGINRFDPKYVDLSQQQKKLGDDLRLIEDSLTALSLRQISIQGIVNREIKEINYNLSRAMENLQERNNHSAAIKQQFIMTSANNLALLLDEALQQMQDALMQQQNGQGSCSKPGGANPKPGQSMDQLKKMMSKQMEEMKKMLEEEGNQPGKDGKEPGGNKAKDFAKMAAQQAAMKEKLKQLEKELQKQGQGGEGQVMELQKDLEQIESELYNKQLSPETLLRQKEILTRLLEAEKGLIERELDEERKSEIGKNKNNRNLILNPQYNPKGVNNKDVLDRVSPAFNSYYKSKITIYFNNFE